MYQFKRNIIGTRLPVRHLSGSSMDVNKAGSTTTFTMSGKSPSLGQSIEQEWYNRAKASLALWDSLVLRVGRIANAASRAELTEWIGHPDIDGTPANRAMKVASDFFHDAAAPPAGEGIFAYRQEKDHRRTRIEKLEAFNDELKKKVALAETEFGITPAQQPPTTQPPTTTIIKGTDLTVPIVAVGGAVTLAILISALT